VNDTLSISSHQNGVAGVAANLRYRSCYQTLPTKADVIAVVMACDELSEDVRASIVAMVEASN
jgi:hypothetical protein